MPGSRSSSFTRRMRALVASVCGGVLVSALLIAPPASAAPAAPSVPSKTVVDSREDFRAAQCEVRVYVDKVDRQPRVFGSGTLPVPHRQVAWVSAFGEIMERDIGIARHALPAPIVPHLRRPSASRAEDTATARERNSSGLTRERRSTWIRAVSTTRAR